MAKTTKGGGGGPPSRRGANSAAAAAAAKKKTPQKKKPQPSKHTTKKNTKKEVELQKKLQQLLLANSKSCMAWRNKLQLDDSDDDDETPTKGQQTGGAIVPYTLEENQQSNNNNNNKKQQQKKKSRTTTATATTVHWPSTLFFNASYANGILVNSSNNKKNNNKSKDYFEPTLGYSNDNATAAAAGDRTKPRLTLPEAKLWCQKHAATTAVARRFPVEVGRILGTITLEIKEVVVSNNNNNNKKNNNKKKTASVFKSDPNALVPESLREIEQKMKKKKPATTTTTTSRNSNNEWIKNPKNIKGISMKQATDEAKAELGGASRDRILSRAREIQEQWKIITNCVPYKQTWDPTDGNYDDNLVAAATKEGKSRSSINKDEQFVNLIALQTWLTKGIKNGTLVDVNQDATKDLYNGLTKIPINSIDIINELVNMSNPQESIYGVPLICAYPRMARCCSSGSGSGGSSPAKATGTGTSTVWKVQLGIYMNRLLPEIFTSRSMSIIMSALDDGSYTCTQPLRLPPTGPDVFKSAPYPKVDTSVLERRGDDDDDSDDSKSSSSSDEIEIIDITSSDDDDMEGGSRDELVISPFSVKGLLKLLENRGCDVSGWPQIERELQGKFKLDLLLHQQHAISWMIQMEHLEGAYGINSLLWEERAFPDGGRYYYSPALGQVRLGAPPPKMKGGLLCDEQGLGKTVEVLGLIMATLPELKERLDKKMKAVAHSPTTVDGDDYYSAESSDDEQDYVAHTTLIIVPPALLAQWSHEIEKAVGKKTLRVSTLVAKTGALQQTLPPPPPPPAGSSSGDDGSDEEDDWDRILASDVVLTTYNALEASCCQKILQTVQWGRVVLDEMQEIRSSTTKIAKNCEKLQCDRRWMLSGTPIYQGIEDLKGELNFLRLEPFGASWEDGFFDFAIKTPWDMKEPRAVDTLQILGLIALRRSKDMTIAATGAGLLDLKPMTVEYVPVPQTESERALYCWIEWLVASELELTKEAKKKDNGLSPRNEKANAKSRALCLRLLRELCITPMLLNGGLGATSQLKEINKLMTNHNQREHRNNIMQLNDDEDGSAARNRGVVPTMSCDQALRFLSQHQQKARTGEDMVSDLLVGGGRGVSNRDRAAEDPNIRYKEAKDDVTKAQKSLNALTKKTAKARWHLALELITTGQYSDGRQHKFSGLWRWRKLVFIAGEQNAQVKTRKAKKNQVLLPALLTRGWRPSADLLGELFMKDKSEFSWSHPHAILATNIPKEVYQKELATAMRDAAKRVTLAKGELESYNAQRSKLTHSKHKSKNDNEKRMKELEAKCQKINEKMDSYKAYDSKLKLPHVAKVRERKNVHGFWKAVIQFDTKEEKEAALAMCGKAQGASITSRRSVPHMKALVASAEDKLSVATAEHQVHPSKQHKKNLAVAKKEVANVGLGLRMVTSTNTTAPTMNEETLKEAGTTHPYVLVSNVLGNQRSLAPRSVSALIESAEETFDDYETQVPRLKTRIADGENVIQILHRAVNGKVSPQVAQLSAYETLEALSSGEAKKKTSCAICLGYLGEAEEDYAPAAAGSKRKRGEAAITMISCSHFFCTRCVRMYLNSGSAGCPACRKPFSLTADTILIDPDLKDEEEALKKEREAAKEIVREAGKVLTESKGTLDAEVWRALYLAFDLPTNVPRLGSQSFPAIPREFLMHLRAATGMQPGMRPKSRPTLKGAGRNSKIEALLDQLPTKERCVVFSSNKDCLLHLSEIFKDDKIGFQLLYTGLSTEQLRDAVTNWESDGDGSQPPFPVLLVHAGAASAGLTLTAASKMFIMEPFLRQEQEHQAYARCHRFSQKHKVSVKVFYTPVSVESRLLEWRKGGKSSLLVSEDKDAENCNFGEQNTDFVIHDVDSDLDDESEDEDEDDEDGSESGGNKKDSGEESHDIAQANYLLGLID